MYKPKTKETDRSVVEFIESVESPKKQADAFKLLEMYEEVSGFEAKMWGPSIIGFGSYHYRYESGHEGDAPLAGFSPRKAKISLYFAPDDPNREPLLAELGKHTTGKSCVYINKLADVNPDVIKKLISSTIEHMKKKYPN
ncbi:DUF1801 domain-containing protein [Alkalihalobacillus pseudalcaliphilus]|uniref:DUF1801 domain-containing protein n=1 Tax=Alkalihalobacillus pseudalcaliphilus TaxID=79884 RepID=UPI00064DA38E|nr:DUF1801 domain-containing protein [Alkalihalobacillus pseudalcaliphilus]KMK75154.1 hypothetical protein AB990_17065 [Alkalihalobacillus pseudalcaliphilus]